MCPLCDLWFPSCPKLFYVVVERSWKCSSSGWVLLFVHLTTPQLYFAQLHGVSLYVCSAHCSLTESAEILCRFLPYSFCAASFSLVPCHKNRVYSTPRAPVSIASAQWDFQALTGFPALHYSPEWVFKPKAGEITGFTYAFLFSQRTVCFCLLSVFWKQLVHIIFNFAFYLW